jgi:hypothetical protein
VRILDSEILREWSAEHEIRQPPLRVDDFFAFSAQKRKYLSVGN